MIEQISGTITHLAPIFVTIDTGYGVSYGIHISVNCSSKWEGIDSKIKLMTFLYVKEGIMELYGFYDSLEKTVFLNLIKVSGIGPKIALRILSESSPKNLIQYICEENVQALSKLKGIGVKTAQMMIASLKSKLKIITLPESQTPSSKISGIEQEALAAFISLGIKEEKAIELIKKIQEENQTLNSKQIITEGLKII